MPCVIPAFTKRGNIIVADRGINLAIQQRVCWFDHNDIKSLEGVLLNIEKEGRKRRGPLTRRSIVTEGIFEKDGTTVDLPKLVSYAFSKIVGCVLTHCFLKWNELKHKYKYCLILIESISVG